MGEEGGRGGELDVSRHTVPLADITMNLDSAILEQQLSAGPMQEMDFLPPLPADALVNGSVGLLCGGVVVWWCGGSW